MLTPTPRTTIFFLPDLPGRPAAPFRYCNQRRREWSHPYDHPLWPTETLSTSGCGIFSLVHAVEWLTGERIDPEPLSDFARKTGGRGNDGTDRPRLLSALTEAGMTERFGFRYDGDGHQNDPELLWTLLSKEGGVALANLRVGHIVSLLAAREIGGEQQVLAVDSVAETTSEKVRDNVRELVPGTEVVAEVKNAAGLVTGYTLTNAFFWVSLDTPRDFDLLHRR